MPLCRLLAYEVMAVCGGAHHAEEGREAGGEVLDLARHAVRVCRVGSDAEGAAGVEGRGWALDGR